MPIEPSETAAPESATPETVDVSDYAPGSAEAIVAETLNNEAVDTHEQERREAEDRAAKPVETAQETDEPKAKATLEEQILEAAKDLADKSEDDDEDEIGPAEVTLRNGKKVENRIPHSRVEQMIAKRLAKAEAAYTAKMQQAETTARQQTLSQMEAQLERVLQTNPEGFLQVLAESSPAFRSYIQQQAPRGRAQAQAQAQSEMPQPDVPLSDGTFTYSVQGLQRLLDWQSQQAEQRIASRYEPVERFMQGLSKQQQVAAVTQQAAQRIRGQLEEAVTWPMFNESVPEITKVLEANPTWGLERAYNKVVIPKLQANSEQVRAQVLKEMNERPHSTSVSATASRGRQPEGKSDEEIVAEALGIKL